jgi:hypothetical protein
MKWSSASMPLQLESRQMEMAEISGLRHIGRDENYRQMANAFSSAFTTGGV